MQLKRGKKKGKRKYTKTQNALDPNGCYKQRRLNKLFLFLFFCRQAQGFLPSYAFLLSLQGMVSEPGLLYLSHAAWSAIWWGFIFEPALSKCHSEARLCKTRWWCGEGWVHLLGYRNPMPSSKPQVNVLIYILFFAP